MYTDGTCARICGRVVNSLFIRHAVSAQRAQRALFRVIAERECCSSSVIGSGVSSVRVFSHVGSLYPIGNNALAIYSVYTGVCAIVSSGRVLFSRVAMANEFLRLMRGTMERESGIG